MPPAGPRGVRRRDTRLDARFVAARATTSRVGSLPRTCRTLRLHLDDFTHGDCRAGARVSASRDEALALEPPDHEASEHEGSNALHGVAVWRPSTVAEHRELPAREEETANAPGRSEGRCEHLDLAVARRRDGRLDGLPRMREAHSQPRPTSRTLRCSGRRLRTEGVASTRPSRPRPHEPARYARPRRTMADATLASTPASSRREPRPHVSGLSPSDLPDTSSTNFTHGSGCVGAHRGPRAGEGPPDHAGSNGLHGVAVWRPSTVAEHRELPAREEETANAPGRSEGRCEHLDPAVARRRDGRLDGLPRMREAHSQPRPTSRTLRCSGRRLRTEGVASSRPRPHEPARYARPRRTMADATLASTPASSRREPRPHVSGLSPSDLPDTSSTNFTHGSGCVGAHRGPRAGEGPPDHAGSNGLHGVAVWRPSTVAEHRELPARDEETANAPGRSEGSAQTRHSPRRPLRRGASHDLTCRVSPSDLPDASPAPRRLHARRLPRWGASQRVSRRGSRLGAAGSRSVGARRVECTARSGRVAPEHRCRAQRAASS
jgi:hypothetical protein